jgi:hypothetical protein
MKKQWVLAAGLLLSASSASAVIVDFTYLTHPSLVGMAPGLDGFWGNGNDVDLSAQGLNTHGTASVAVSSDLQALSFVRGGFQSDDHLDGTFDYVSLTVSADVVITGFGESSNTQELSATGANSGTYTVPAQTTSSTYETILQMPSIGLVDAIFHFESAGAFVVRGQDPATLFSGDLVTHLNFLIPLLPSNWNILYVAAESYQQIGGPFAGFNTVVAYSVVPVPAALPLFAVALGGLAAVRRRRIQHR